jgi:SlyX protein
MPALAVMPMSDITRLMARIEALEMRAAHQDKVIEDLNTVATEQWTQIDLLKRQIELLRDRVQELENSRNAAGLPEPPPPHY